MKKFYIVLPGKDVEFAVISRDVNTVVQAAEPIARKDDSENNIELFHRVFLCGDVLPPRPGKRLKGEEPLPRPPLGSGAGGTHCLQKDEQRTLIIA